MPRQRKPTKQRALEALINGREHIADIENWHQGSLYAAKENRPVSHSHENVKKYPEDFRTCAIGSLYITTLDERVIQSATSVLDQCAIEQQPGVAGIVVVNDRDRHDPMKRPRQHKKVLKAFDCAIDKLKAVIGNAA